MEGEPDLPGILGSVLLLALINQLFISSALCWKSLPVPLSSLLQPQVPFSLPRWGMDGRHVD